MKDWIPRKEVESVSTPAREFRMISNARTWLLDVGGSAWPRRRRDGDNSDEPRDRLDLEIFLIY